MSTSDGINLVMPMAGRGSRFAKEGISEPKPLIELLGRPFFWWAVESLRQTTSIASMNFVVLKEHCERNKIDKRIHEYYPEAKITAIEDVTSGAAETAWVGVSAVEQPGPIAVNDCDHAFYCSELPSAPRIMRESDMGLLTFRSDKPNYSYVLFDESGAPKGTIEKVVASPHAITGCYFFRSPELFLKTYEAYRTSCPYDELFISGMFNLDSGRAPRIHRFETEQQWAFGTPEEYASVDQAGLRSRFGIAA